MTAALPVGNGDRWPLAHDCPASGRHTLPLWVHQAVALQVRRDVPNIRTVSHLVIADYRCRHCKRFIPVTLGDLFGR